MSKKLSLSAIRAAAVIGGLLVIALFGACGGGNASPPENTAVPTPTVLSAIPLDSFHYVASVTLEEQRREPGGDKLEVRTEGDFQAPDRHSLTYTERFGDLSIARSLVLIGDDAWFRENEGVWQPVTLADPRFAEVLSTAFTAIRPNFLGGPTFDQARASIKRLYSTAEDVNGLATNHYVVGDPGREYFSELLADQDFLQNVRDLNWNLWLAIEGDWPVRLQADATVTRDLQLFQDLNLTAPTSWNLSIDVSRPNDPALAIAPPIG